MKGYNTDQGYMGWLNGEYILTINFRDDSIMLDEGTLDALGRPAMVQVMINRDSKIPLLRSCGADSDEPFLMPEGAAEKAEIPGRKILRDICRVTGFEPTWPRICMGVAVPGQQAVFFELEYAVPVVMPAADGSYPDDAPTSSADGGASLEGGTTE